MDVSKINERINEEYCLETDNKLSDKYLKKTYLKTKSFKKNMKDISETMRECEISERKIKKFLKKYQEKLIAPGTKGATRGNLFNKHIKDEILKWNLDETRFLIKFEKKNNIASTDEIPDWFIECQQTGKVIVGMNQLDFWGGGQQYNRGFKYVVNNKYNSENNIKFLNVVCNNKKINSKRTKIYTIFNVGFTNDTLCYIKGIERIVKSFFEL